MENDSIYRGGLLLAAETSQGQRHYHLDHLGTPRLISDSLGQQKAYHAYYPYGEEATVYNQDTIRNKFTGHERDLGNAGGAGDDLDYMHARHSSPLTGRFLSVDPVRGKATRPQSWNRYSYVIGNPLRFVDPDGRSFWTTVIRVIRQSPDGTRRVVATFRNLSKQRSIERTKNALREIDQRQRNQGNTRAVQVKTKAERQKMAEQLSSDKKARQPEKSGGKNNPLYPRHQNPREGEFSDVHVESQDDLLGVGIVVATLGTLGEVISEAVAPASSAVSEVEEATPGELLSAGAWDVTSALDPIGVTDAINWYFEID